MLTRRFVVSPEQRWLILLLLIYHLSTYFVMPPDGGDYREAWVERLTKQAPPNYTTTEEVCFSAAKTPPKPLIDDHPCIVDRKPGSASKEPPVEPKKSIVLIEHSPMATWKIAYQICNMLTHLTSDWRVQLMYPEGTRRDLEVWLEEYIQTGQIQFLDIIPPTFKRLPDYNDLLRSKDLWTGLWGDWVLVTHTDSGICPLNAEYQLEDFFCYDSIGAAWAWWPVTKYQAGNGGFVLRRRSLVLHVIDKYPVTDIEKRDVWEDVWYHAKFLMENATLPSIEAETMFSIEAFFGDSYGFHKFWAFNGGDHSTYLKAYCPEAIALWGIFYGNDAPYDIKAWPKGQPNPDWSK